MGVGIHACFVYCCKLEPAPSNSAWYIVGFNNMCPFVSVFSASHSPFHFYSCPLLPSPLFPVASSFRVTGPLSSNELFIIHLPLEHCESFGVCVLLHPLIPVPSTDPDTGVTEAEEPNPVSTLPPLPTLGSWPGGRAL